MDQTTTPAPPPPLTATTAVATTTTTTTVDSSPHSRTTDSWVQDTSLHPSNHRTTVAHGGGLNKLRLMCSYGGHIVPRPHDKSLCYVGGDTRIVVVDRHTTLTDLTHRLTKTLIRSNTLSTTNSFTIKYQLPSEDLDSLISITTDEDLENMIDEYERLNVNSSSDGNKSSRIRLFLFPTKPESVSSIGSVLESASKSEDWFLNALNGTSSGFSDTSSVNCLLGLEDDVSVPEKKDARNKGVIGKNLRGNCYVQDVQSVPDSPMLETSSSFGSASPTPSLANLPVITVTVDDQQKVAGGIDEQFSQVSLQQQLKHQEDVKFVVEPSPVVIADDHHKQQQQQQQHQRKPSKGFDLTSPDSVSSDGSITKPPAICQDPAAHNQFPTNIDQNTRIQIQQQQIQDSAYLHSSSATRIDLQNHQLHHQPQFIHTAVPPPQYLHHQQTGAVPMASFYQIYPPQTQYQVPQSALDQHNFVYYMPASQPPQGYNNASPAVSTPSSSQVPPPSGLFTTPQAVQSAAKTDPPAGVYRTTVNSGSSTPQLVQGPSSQQQMQPQFASYSPIYQPSQPNPSGGGGGNYVYEFADPSQQGHHIYYAAQPVAPQAAAQYQPIASTLPVEAQAGSHLQAGSSMNQQVRTSQP